MIPLFQSEQRCAVRHSTSETPHSRGLRVSPRVTGLHHRVSSSLALSNLRCSLFVGMEPPLCGLCLHSLGWSWALAPHLRSPNQCALWGEAQESLCGCINVFTCRSATLYKLGPLFLWDIQTTKTSRLRMAVCLRLPSRCRMHPAS